MIAVECSLKTKQHQSLDEVAASSKLLKKKVSGTYWTIAPLLNILSKKNGHKCHPNLHRIVDMTGAVHCSSGVVTALLMAQRIYWLTKSVFL